MTLVVGLLHSGQSAGLMEWEGYKLIACIRVVDKRDALHVSTGSVIVRLHIQRTEIADVKWTFNRLWELIC